MRLGSDGSGRDAVDGVVLHQLLRVRATLAPDGAAASPVPMGQSDQPARGPIVVAEQLAPSAPPLPGPGGLGWASRSTCTRSSPRAARSTQAAWLKRRRSPRADTRTTLISGVTDERHGATPRVIEPPGRLPRRSDVARGHSRNGSPRSRLGSSDVAHGRSISCSGASSSAWPNTPAGTVASGSFGSSSPPWLGTACSSSPSTGRRRCRCRLPTRPAG